MSTIAPLEAARSSLSQHHDRLSARAVEIDELEVEAAFAVAEIGEIGVQRAEHRSVKLGHVLGVGLAFDLEVMLAEIESHGRGARGRRNVEILHRPGLFR
jgi:hypothetical protein